MRALMLVLGLASAMNAAGQRNVDTSTYARHTVYASILGEGLYFSVNYERRWPVGRGWMSLSSGLTYVTEPSWHLSNDGSWSVSGDSYSSSNARVPALFSLPIRWNWFSGRKHHREHGVGLALGHAWWAAPGIDGYEADLMSTSLCVSLKPIGYRFQRRDGGVYASIYSLLLVKAIEFNGAWSDYLRSENNSINPINLWIGLDLGYTFHNHKNKHP